LNQIVWNSDGISRISTWIGKSLLNNIKINRKEITVKLALQISIRLVEVFKACGMKEEGFTVLAIVSEVFEIQLLIK